MYTINMPDDGLSFQGLHELRFDKTVKASMSQLSLVALTPAVHHPLHGHHYYMVVAHSNL